MADTYTVKNGKQGFFSKLANSFISIPLGIIIIIFGCGIIWNNEKKNVINIKDVKELNVNMEYLGKSVDKSNNKVNGKTFVITGTLSKPRDVYKEVLENLGANVTGTVTKKTDYVLVGDNPGSKYDKAKELGITIINEEEYNDLVM